MECHLPDGIPDSCLNQETGAMALSQCFSPKNAETLRIHEGGITTTVQSTLDWHCLFFYVKLQIVLQFPVSGPTIPLLCNRKSN